MSTIILQSPSTHETRVIHTASMLLDHIQVFNSNLDSLNQFARHLQDGALPVGSVEFVRKAMQIAGISEPQFSCYPGNSKKYWRRNIELSTVGQLGESIDNQVARFIKPVKTKLFSGFILDTSQDLTASGAYAREQMEILATLSKNEPIWVSDPVEWQSEWRYYVAHGEIIGSARYDDGDESAAKPDLWVVQRCIADLALAQPYALDMGVLASGQTALVEVNDAWAIGLYGKAMESKNYLYFLRSRWRELFGNSKNAKTK